jgi:HSP20 family protein
MYEDPMDMSGEMDDLFSHLFDRMTRDFATGEPQGFGYRMIIQEERDPSRSPGLRREPVVATSEPVVEIHRIGEEVKVITELPGMTMDAIDLKLRGSTLCIAAGPRKYHARADLPRVDPGSMQTSLKNGVLEVTFTVLPDIPEGKGS